ncbi:hypothetical protein A3C23_05020 [Candidatus Roizmanbacteria bacterium RIFCSPHIGHO2_02_FULL_37_13b]|uniref:Transposase IS200-like domain-containing protein n=1 Tax=Candidatus Roizmanbacteria bacterium RIFCSPLOWO2_02_FULL_36_11 TaxID=1802071 RepID=A0A1F7JIM8_9BACT|nr:MAG: hypothetical protein A3C23_05020 [Candidatus Roizmanbacteria bacterium RIFCSPHIGHO2_02_FULL_37_13b]OGK55457.1 MAG: hypothetical protein A3H78_01205 [Candidatus Roizmanbacteria bacterium RIFCSPLOWO2_02_FULL_36_11]
MPERGTKFINKGIYHIFNKTIDKKKVFTIDKYAERFLELLRYYRSRKSIISYSRFKKNPSVLAFHTQDSLNDKRYFRIEILGFCLMSNHFHLLLKQNSDNGVQDFVRLVLNGFTRYVNLNEKRRGPFLLPRFESRSILTDEVLMHISRYIHLNPFSAGIVKNIDQLKNYRWSSYSSYLQEKKDDLIERDIVLKLFNVNPRKYQEFVENHADYQKSLEYIKL